VDDETDIDELGPVDWIVVEFPGSKFNGEIAPALADLVERDLVRVLDLLVLKKESDGTLEAFELSDLDDAEIGGFRSHEQELAMLLSEEDVTAVAAAVEPGSSAAVLVWENKWAAPFGAAVRHAGGQLVASGRIPIQASWPRSRPTTNRTTERRREMPLARRRMRRAAVIGPAPVARTAATVATAAVVIRGRPAS
jgi:hypothetical protein